MRLYCSNYLKSWFPLAIVRPGEISLPMPSSFLSAATAINSFEQSRTFLSGPSAAGQAASAATDQQQRTATTTTSGDLSSGAAAAGVPTIHTESSSGKWSLKCPFK